MENTIAVQVQEVQLKPKEYKKQRVVTFKDIDRVHNRPDGTARRNFVKNRQHFQENRDFHKVIQLDEIRSLGITSNFGAILITESGYLMLVKSFTDKKAWQVQRALVDNYFRIKSGPTTEQTRIEESYTYKPKYWKGEQVVTITDIVELTKQGRWAYNHAVTVNSGKFKQGEAWLLGGSELACFRKENPGVLERHVRTMWIFTKRGLAKLFRLMRRIPVGINVWLPESPKRIDALKAIVPKAAPTRKPTEEKHMRNPAFFEKAKKARDALAALNFSIDMLSESEGVDAQYLDLCNVHDEIVRRALTPLFGLTGDTYSHRLALKQG